jgi:hypothetical protein
MGRQQFYKGNPELKQYYLVNDFTGGINNTSVDERTEDNEFRELINVELTKKGLLQNRKGWGRLRLFNALLTSKNIYLPSDTIEEEQIPVERYALIQIVKNEGNLLSLIEEYDSKNVSLNEFNTFGFNYDLEMIMIYQDATGIKLGRLSLSSAQAEDKNIFEVIVTLTTSQLNGNKPLTNIETINYTDYIYFSLSQLASTTPGFGEYNVSTKAFRFVRDDELPNAFIYKPNPYEATKVGFNVLSNTPLTDVRTVSTFLGITGVFLTTLELDGNGKVVDTQTPIQSIPLNGRFTVNALFTGNFNVLDTIVQFYYFKNDNQGIPQETNIPFKILDIKKEDEIGVVRYGVSVDVKGFPNVFFRIKLKSGTLFDTNRIKTFTTLESMVNFFTPQTNTKAVIYNVDNKHFDVYNKTSLLYDFEKLTGITYNSVLYSPIYDDKLFTFTRQKRWEDAAVEDYNNQTNFNLKSIYRTEACNVYSTITTTTLNETGSLLNINNYNTGHVVEVRGTRWMGSYTQIWANTNNINYYYTRELEENIFDTATAENIGNLVNISATNNIVGQVLRVRKMRTIGESIWTSSNIQEYGPLPDIYIPYEDFLNLDTVTTSLLSFGSARDYSLGTTVSVGAVSPIGGTPNRYFSRVYTVGLSDTLTRKIFLNEERFFQIVTSKLYANCSSPVQVKYFKVSTEPIGTTTPVVTFNSDLKKFYYRFEETKTEIVYNDTRVVENINELVPVTFGKYLIGSDPNSQTAYYRYLGTTEGDETDFEQITFVEAIEEVEYNDNYLISEPSDLKKIEALDTKGFRIIEIGSRLVYYKENIIWFSDLYQFDYIPNYNYIILPLSPNDRITGIIYFKGSYMIFTKERIYKMSGTFGGQDFQIQIVSDAIGCISPFSIKAFNNTVVFMTVDGLYRVKQNYYSGGLENVEKIDKQLTGVVPYNVELYSVLYNEQYFLFYDYPTNQPTTGFNVLKMYYNMDAPNGYPFVKDLYSILPEVIAKFDDGLYSIRYGEFYKYDKGYSDFTPNEELTTDEKQEYMYVTKVRTSNLFFNYPTHDKKFKAILVKTNCNAVVPLYFNIYVDNRLIYSSQDFKVTREGNGQLTYNAVDVASIELQAGDTLGVDLTGVTIGNTGALGQLDLGIDKLGDTSTQTHKIVLAGKGKNITVEVYQKLDEYFGIQDIGYVYKIGKAREDR